MIIRMFDTALDPDDVEHAKELFRTQVRPAFESFAGCHGIDMYMGLEAHSGGLVDVAALSRWDSRDSIEAATKTPEYNEALTELKKLFQQVPLVRHFEIVD